jgi:hypothetical protein
VKAETTRDLSVSRGFTKTCQKETKMYRKEKEDEEERE